MDEKQEGKEMGLSEKQLKINFNKLKQIAKSNTVKNEKGQTIITKDDPFREDPDFHTSIKSGSNK